MKKSTNETKTTKVKYTVEVTRAKEVSDGRVAFDMKVNGVTIYGCWYIEGEKDGKEYTIINLPQTKGKDGKYYSIAWFPMSKEIKGNIIEQLEKMV